MNILDAQNLELNRKKFYEIFTNLQRMTYFWLHVLWKNKYYDFIVFVQAITKKSNKLSLQINRSNTNFTFELQVAKGESFLK